jgi:hypothetical protein
MSSEQIYTLRMPQGNQSASLASALSTHLGILPAHSSCPV